ncbi:MULTISPECIES: dihydrodipicolinate synthase family protein [Halomonadaceae]|uniref:dihydrodipicolinate synthase family protein n=1 Tax=Halomonadaceae TaxID=28256 RepID=UPI00159963F5|nr:MULTISPECIES: dihydrodipicolinate synthase family protein [Halomonas]QJQ95517.1 dihydrodipicolinate synthase family protein [Halomonas sp. PA5]
MNSSSAKGKVWSPVVTPFQHDLSPDLPRYIEHCRWLVNNDVGLAVFGTNSEANSLAVSHKQQLLDALVGAGVPGSRLMPGTGSCAIEDAVMLSRHALEAGCHGVLMLPPFYYKNVPDEGLYRYFAEVVERVGDAALKIYLYHIPPVAQVPISLGLIERLRKAYPETFVGIKDSSGDWGNTRAMIRQFAADGFQVYAGNERFLLQTMREGGAGCISATANVNGRAIVALAQRWQERDADQAQLALNVTREIFEGFPMIPALKSAIADFRDSDDWCRVRPPLVALNKTQRRQLATALNEHGFSM